MTPGKDIFFTLFLLLINDLALLARPPYLVPGGKASLRTDALLSTGQHLPSPTPAQEPYYFAGTPDGLGALRADDGTIHLFVSHAFAPDRGAVRQHGAAGAFISHWTGRWDMENQKLILTSGQDLIQKVFQWDGQQYQLQPNPPPFARLSSGDLPPVSAHFDQASQTGYPYRLFLCPEEMPQSGKAWGHVVSGSDFGSSYPLPAFGSARYENILLHPQTGRQTLAIALSDRKEGFLILYLGEKSKEGSPPARAGLLHGMAFVAVVETALPELGGSVNLRWQALPELRNSSPEVTDLILETSDAQPFAQPKDGYWNPADPTQFYFTTNGKGRGSARTPSRLFRLVFDNLQDPLNHTRLELLLEEGTHPFHRLDNMTIDASGLVWLQENPGTMVDLARLFSYQPATGQLSLRAQSNPAFFKPGEADFLTAIEESTGIIDLSSVIGDGYLLSAFHSHISVDNPHSESDHRIRQRFQWSQDQGKSFVEDGQILILSLPNVR